MLKLWSSLARFLRKFARSQPVKAEERWLVLPYDFRVDWYASIEELDGELSRASSAQWRPATVVPRSTRLCRLCDPAKGQKKESSVVDESPSPKVNGLRTTV
jgi:hypothetical protein